jgi:hypothetical protein
MKALCDLDTNAFNSGARRFASSLDRSFANECVKLIGLKSVTFIALAFFGIKTMCAVFRCVKCWLCWL